MHMLTTHAEELQTEDFELVVDLLCPTALHFQDRKSRAAASKVITTLASRFPASVSVVGKAIVASTRSLTTGMPDRNLSAIHTLALWVVSVMTAIPNVATKFVPSFSSLAACVAASKRHSVTFGEKLRAFIKAAPATVQQVIAALLQVGDLNAIVALGSFVIELQKVHQEPLIADVKVRL